MGKPIRVHTRGRYGDSESATGAKAVEKLIRSRVDELCDEQFARPDYEHRRVSVRNEGEWYIEVSMSGLATLGRHEPPERDRYLYGLPKEELVRLLMQLARGEMDAVLARPWSATWEAVLGPRDVYLFANHPEMTDLHRAAAKGDLPWVEAELAAGADVNAPDRHGATPLHWAAITGRSDVCKRLLAAGADPKAADRDGATPAEYAKLSYEYTSKAEADKLVRTLKTAAGTN